MYGKEGREGGEGKKKYKEQDKEGIEITVGQGRVKISRGRQRKGERTGKMTR